MNERSQAERGARHRMSYESWTSLTAMFFEQADRLGDAPFLWAKRDKAYLPWTWSKVAQDVAALAGGLKAMGLTEGDRVVVVSENRPEWLIADIATMAAGGITVPAYTTNTVGDHLHILNNSAAKVVVVSTKALAERVLAAACQATQPPQVIIIERTSRTQNSGVEVQAWAEVLKGGTKSAYDARKRAGETRRDDCACIIYTSGTGGAPKGVMLSHGAILHNCQGAYRVLCQMGLADEVFLSFLPLSHSYEHTAGQFFPISLGAQIYYAEGADTLAANMLEARPTIMTAVPRLYETMRARILRGVERTGGIKAWLFGKALELGSRRYETGGRLGLIDGAVDFALERLVRDKVRARFGGRLKAMVSGGAPLNYDVGLFFTALGVRILQGYGQTESAPVVSCNPPDRVKLDTVGRALDGVEVKLAADGELLVRGELVMQGYWGDIHATTAAIQDGRWLHTGDIAEIDPEGYIRITDRKKDIIVNSGGDNLSPQRVEGFLTLQPEIAQAMVFGDRRPHLVALIVPNQDFADTWTSRHGGTAELGRLIAEPEFRRAVAAAIERVNTGLSPLEKVRRFMLTAEPFTVANEMMTPTMKIRRHKIREVYGAALERLYE